MIAYHLIDEIGIAVLVIMDIRVDIQDEKEACLHIVDEDTPENGAHHQEVTVVTEVFLIGKMLHSILLIDCSKTRMMTKVQVMIKGKPLKVIAPFYL